MNKKSLIALFVSAAPDQVRTEPVWRGLGAVSATRTAVRYECPCGLWTDRVCGVDHGNEQEIKFMNREYLAAERDE